jgi:hypothetical protein
VPIGPTCGSHGGSASPTAPVQLRALQPVKVGWNQVVPLLKEK